MNLGTGTGTSIKQLIGAIEEVTAGDPPTLFAEAQKTKDTLDWKPKYDLKQIVAGAIRWEENLAQFLREP